MVGIIVKKYEHYNRALGKYISSKKQYENEMAMGGYVPLEEGIKLAEQAHSKMHKPYNGISEKALAICKTARNSADKKGNVHLGGRMIDAMKEVGVSFDTQHLPSHYQPNGGFDAI